MSKARHKARSRAVQALYQWQMSGNDIREVEEYFLAEQNMNKTDMEYFSELLHEVPKNLSELDGHISPTLDRPFEEIDPVEKAILRIGTYELVYRKDVPYRVVINECVELAKSYGAEEGHKYINSVLDRLALRLRDAEVNAKRTGK
ncbi:MAG: transcription antitermination factor NusB [Gammaproteobacteria bacterium]|nr:transcription antitermination factor NusB [Gammaproteobacteria bacterium]